MEEKGLERVRVRELVQEGILGRIDVPFRHAIGKGGGLIRRRLFCKGRA